MKLNYSHLSMILTKLIKSTLTLIDQKIIINLRNIYINYSKFLLINQANFIRNNVILLLIYIQKKHKN